MDPRLTVAIKMRIRVKTTLIVAATIVLLVLLIQIVVFNIVVGEAEQTEKKQSQDTVDQVHSEIDHRTGDLNTLCSGWACWDDLYRFIQDRNQGFIDEDLSIGSLSNLDVNLIIFFNESHAIVYDVFFDTGNGTIQKFPDSTLSALTDDPILFDHTNTSSIYGILDLPSGLCMISSWEILHSDESGPGIGTVIFGKYIDSTWLQDIPSGGNSTMSLVDINDPDMTPVQQKALQGFFNESHYAKIDVNQSAALSFGLINDINGQPDLLITVEMSRDVYMQAIDGYAAMSVAIVLFALCIIVIIYILLNTMVIARLTDLERDVNSISKGDGPERRVSVYGNDEIHSLSVQINGMVESLEQRTQELRDSEGLYKSLMEQSVEAIVMVDPASRAVLQSNPTFCSIFGFAPEEIPRLDLLCLLPDGVSPSIVDRIIQEHRVVGMEVRLRTKGGRIIDAVISGSTIEYLGNTAVCITGWDITERRKVEAVQDKMEKLEAVGNLAGGMAHDFNNLLTGIIGNVSLLRNQMASDPLAMERLQYTEIAAIRAKEIAQELLSLSKGGEPIRQETDLNKLITDTAQVYLQDSNVHFKFVIPHDTWAVYVDPGQVGRVFLNLFINAKEAMPKGGEVQVSAKNCEFAEGEFYPLAAGRYVLVSVKDNGTGIPPEILPRIFDPFFTTKRTGNGMGLSVVYTTIRRHGGMLEVESRMGQGTTFRIFLPVVDGHACTNASEELKPGEPDRRKKYRILLMDDQDVVVEVAAEMLRELGNEVTVSRDGLEALELYRRSMEDGKRFDAVIMDLTIPQGMGGKEAIKRLLAMDPAAKAIVSSGYSSDPVMAHFSDHGFAGVLPKPFRIEDLDHVIRRACFDPPK